MREKEIGIDYDMILEKQQYNNSIDKNGSCVLVNNVHWSIAKNGVELKKKT